MTNIKNKAHLKDSMDMLKLMGWTTDAAIDRNGKELKVGDIVAVKTSDPTLNLGKVVRISGDQISVDVTGHGDIWTTPARKAVMMKNSKDSCGKIYTKGESTEDQCKDDDATEMGAFEQLGQNHETEAMEPEEHPVLAQDAMSKEEAYQILREPHKYPEHKVEEAAKVATTNIKDDEVGEKFKTVMEEFGKGELESSSGEKVTDPKQAKAIAYSEQREATKDASDRRGVQLKVGDLVAVHGKVGKITRVIRARDERDDVVEVFFDNSGTNNPDRVDRYYANETTKDSDPKVAEANKLINLFGGAM